MDRIVLKPMAIFDGLECDYGAVQLRELQSLAIVSLAMPQGGEDKCANSVKDAWGCAVPGNGRYVQSKDGFTRIIRTQPDQLFALFDHEGDDARNLVHDLTRGAFWTTEQTDVWCALQLSGATSREILARICSLDLHPGVFASDHAARTTMEHLGAIILRSNEDEFVLLSARSSAKSFLHAIETSIRNVLGPV